MSRVSPWFFRKIVFHQKYISDKYIGSVFNGNHESAVIFMKICTCRMKILKYERILACTHVEDYGHWIPQGPTGKKRESHRIPQESNGNSRKWKQYSDRKFVGFFPVNSSQFPVLLGRNLSKIIGKNPTNFRWEYCSHVPAISDDFLSEPARNLRPG